jgi:hypothetical protein
MNPYMGFQLFLCTKCFFTVGTLEWPFTSMNPGVFCQFGFISTNLATKSTLVKKGSEAIHGANQIRLRHPLELEKITTMRPNM